MTQATGGVVTELRAASKDHTDTAGEFKRLDTAVMNEVEGLKANNRGDLMTKLDVIQNEWSIDVQAVAAEVDAMAEALNQAANKIQDKDSGSGGSMGR